MPIVRANNWPADLVNTARAFGMQILGAVLDAEARNLAQVDPPERFALVLGSEGPGLGASTKAICDQLVTIPMAPEKADSLNVATAGAIFLFALTQPRQSD